MSRKRKAVQEQTDQRTNALQANSYAFGQRTRRGRCPIGHGGNFRPSIRLSVRPSIRPFVRLYKKNTQKNIFLGFSQKIEKIAEKKMCKIFYKKVFFLSF